MPARVSLQGWLCISSRTWAQLLLIFSGNYTYPMRAEIHSTQRHPLVFLQNLLFYYRNSWQYLIATAFKCILTKLDHLVVILTEDTKRSKWNSERVYTVQCFILLLETQAEMILSLDISLHSMRPMILLKLISLLSLFHASSKTKCHIFEFFQAFSVNGSQAIAAWLLRLLQQIIQAPLGLPKTGSRKLILLQLVH